MDKAYEIIVKGKVQGVGFRYFVKQKADILGVNGWVKNNYDGTVEIFAEGKEKNIEMLINYCEQGNSHSRVVNVYKQEVPSIEIKNFKIKN